MSRIFDAPFEAATVAQETLSQVGSPVISYTQHYTGVTSMRCNAAGSEVSAKMFTNLSSATDLIHRVYIFVVAAPNADVKIIQLVDAGGNNTSIRLNTTMNLELWDDSAATQSGSDSSALSANTWYRVEIACGTTHAGNDVQAQINGTEFANRATANAGADHRSILVGVMGSVTCDVYFDAVATNNTSGSTNTLFPGPDFYLSKTLNNKLRPHAFSPGLAR